MKLSNYFLPTVREIPSDAEIPSHRLMIRAGMIRKVAAGIYSLLPLGLRVIRKVENIVREEMNKAGAIETLLPSIVPSELWKETGRWDFYGKELLRITDRHQNQFCYGPTHEEVMTNLVRNEVKSYKQLPLNLYQIQTKFRDEIRPRFGVMRSREFTMKDGYSFDCDEEAAAISYQKMHDAYSAVFRRSGLRFGAVEADTGQIGGSASHEFMVFAETGEDVVVSCSKCGFASNVEKAEVSPAVINPNEQVPQLPIEEIETPDKKTIGEVSGFLGKEEWEFIKTLIYTIDSGKEHIAVLVRGDFEINEPKLKNLLGADEIELASPETVKDITNASTGFAGPHKLECRIVADNSIENMVNAVSGANRDDYHLININIGRDFTPDIVGDVRLISLGDPCPKCRDTIEFHRGIEVGHIFRLGTKYSEAMKATYLDTNGKKKTIVMGTYGIGIARIAAAAIEQCNDENGIIWPYSIAPFQVVIIPLNIKNSELVNSANGIEEKLREAGFEVLHDDRNERAGVKFADADLIGIPIQVIIGPRGISNGEVEIKVRATGERRNIKIEELTDEVQKISVKLLES